YQRQRKIPAAHAVLRDAVALYPRDLKLVRSLSWLELMRGNTPAAIAVLEDALKVNPEALDLMVPLADLLAQQGDTARTTEIVKRLESRPAPKQSRGPAAARQSQVLQVKYLKARLAMRDRQWVEATALLESLRREVTSLPTFESQLNLLLASCAAQLADREAEQKAYQRIVLTDPKNVQARVGLGNLYMSLGKFEDAFKELEAATQSPYAPGSVVSQYAHAKTRWLRATGGSNDEWRRVEKILNESRGRFGPASSEPIVLTCEIGRSLGKTAEVVQLLRREVASRPGDTRLWAVLADATADLRGTSAALGVVDEAQSAAGDGADVRLARARLYANEPGRVRPVAPLMDQIESWPESEQIRLLTGLVEVFDHTADHAGVVRALRAIASRRPSDATAWVRLHERALRAGDAKSAAEARSALVKLEGESGKSVLLCDAAAATAADAGPLLARVTAVFGENPVRAEECLARGRLASLAGNETEAARLAERAFTIEPTRFEAARGWLTRLCASGEDERTRQLVTRLATDPRWAGDPFLRIVSAVVPKVQPPAAEKLVAWSRPYAERNTGGLRWLADIAVASGNPALDPVALLDEATKRKDANIDDWLRLALARRPEDLNLARGKVQPADYFGAAAVLLETTAGRGFTPALGSSAEGRMLAQARLGVKLSRNKTQEAAALLEAYLAQKDLVPADAAWCRRNLAMLYAVGGTPQDRKRAMDLIVSVNDASTSPEELRATASVLTTLARYLEGRDRVAVLTRAAAALAVAHEKGKSAQDLYNLSQLYRAAGNRVESRKCLQSLLATELDPNNTKPKNIYYLTAALDELVESREFEAAANFAKLLIRDHSGEFLAVASVARYEARAGRPEAALATAEGYARAANPSAGDHLTRSSRVAELLDEIARLPGVRGTPAGRAITDAAVERYEAVVSTRAEAIVGVVGLLAADGRTADAFGRIEHFGRYLPARVRSAAGLAIVRAGGASEKQAAMVLGWLDECLAEHPDSAALRMSRGEFLAMRNDLAGAAAEYQKICDAEPRNVVALNNLAWILSADPATAEQALELVTRATREVGLTGDLLDTRARVRITLRQFADAERDLNDAIRLEPTPLRWFHLALSRLGQTPPKTDDAAKAFQEALRRGLEQRNVHPADRGTFDSLATGTK
ncbi:MAG TPA: tetratricopeptide repeat protein, partial [Gemmata sp.]|nr:tetratricopeptide repeat protein [Gemmata sp.]